MISASFGISFISSIGYAIRNQIPREVPHPSNNSAIDLTNPADIVLYIILPLICLTLYVIIRFKKKKN